MPTPGKQGHARGLHRKPRQPICAWAHRGELRDGCFTRQGASSRQWQRGGAESTGPGGGDRKREARRIARVAAQVRQAAQGGYDFVTRGSASLLRRQEGSDTKGN